MERSASLGPGCSEGRAWGCTSLADEGRSHCRQQIQRSHQWMKTGTHVAFSRQKIRKFSIRSGDCRTSSQLKGTPEKKLSKWGNLKRRLMCIQIQDKGTKHSIVWLKVFRVKWEYGKHWETIGLTTQISCKYLKGGGIKYVRNSLDHHKSSNGMCNRKSESMLSGKSHVVM